MRMLRLQGTETRVSPMQVVKIEPSSGGCLLTLKGVEKKLAATMPPSAAAEEWSNAWSEEEGLDE